VFFDIPGHHLDLEVIMLDLGGEVTCPPDDGGCLYCEGDEEFSILRWGWHLGMMR